MRDPAAQQQLIIGSLSSPILVFVLLLPTMVFYFGVSSSLTLGTCIAMVILLCISFCAPALHAGAALGPGALTVLVGSAITIHTSIASLLAPLDFLRTATSLVPLMLVLLGGYALGRLFYATPPSNLDRAIYRSFVAFCVIGLLPSLGVSIEISGQSYDKPVFPFTEPSHFALSFTPLLMYCAANSIGSRRFLVLMLGVIAAALLQNLTLIMGCLLVAFVCLRILPLVMLLLVVVAVATQVDLSYYVVRLNFSDDTQNLSSLVYIQGWQLLDDALRRSHGWGLGFQQLGVMGVTSSISDVILALAGDYMNILDGGFTFAKLVSEFGTMGLLMVLFYLIYAWRAVWAVRRHARRETTMNADVLLAQAVIASYGIELFVRGVGYFNCTAVLLIASFWIISAHRHDQAREWIAPQPYVIAS